VANKLVKSWSKATQKVVKVRGPHENAKHFCGVKKMDKNATASQFQISKYKVQNAKLRGLTAVG